MPTNLALDDGLINEARAIGQHRTKREAVTRALEDYVRRHRQMKLLDLFGTVEMDPTFDAKAERRVKRG